MRNLILDVGMHWGNDTEFYLAKGFDVVAIEANPSLVRRVEGRFPSHLADERLRIFNCAVAEHRGTTTFWEVEDYDDWGTTSDDFARRNAALGAKMTPVTVPCRPFADILDECGTPYYLKIDIEGSDLLCIEALRGREMPQYVSVEAEMSTPDGFFEQLSLLWNLGYRHFKLINQGLPRSWRCPDPPREGLYVNHRFADYSSGLFGKELPGQWLSANDILSEAQPLLRDQRLFGLNSPRFKSPLSRCYRGYKKLTGNPVAWFDLHAMLDPAPLTVRVKQFEEKAVSVE